MCHTTPNGKNMEIRSLNYLQFLRKTDDPLTCGNSPWLGIFKSLLNSEEAERDNKSTDFRIKLHEFEFHSDMS